MFVKKLGVMAPYGRERAFYGEMLDNRNMLTTNAIARLLHSIVGGVAVSECAIAIDDGFTQT